MYVSYLKFLGEKKGIMTKQNYIGTPIISSFNFFKEINWIHLFVSLNKNTFQMEILINN